MGHLNNEYPIKVNDYRTLKAVKIRKNGPALPCEECLTCASIHHALLAVSADCPHAIRLPFVGRPSSQCLAGTLDPQR